MLINSFKFSVSLKKKIAISVTIIGQKVLYKGKNITLSIFFILFILENIEREYKKDQIKESNIINRIFHTS